MRIRHAAGWLAMAALGVALAAGAAHAQTADDLVRKNTEAKGGLAKLKSVSTMKLVGVLEVQGQAISMTMWTKRPNLMMQEMLVNGQRVVNAFDGERVWSLNPLAGASQPVEVRGPEAQMVRDQADFDGPLVDYKAKGYVAEVLGPDTIEGVKVIKLKLAKPGGMEVVVHLDAASGLERKLQVTINQTGGAPMTIENVLADYKTVDGFAVPHTVTTSVNGQVMGVMRVESVQYGVPIENTFFSMPAK